MLMTITDGCGIETRWERRIMPMMPDDLDVITEKSLVAESMRDLLEAVTEAAREICRDEREAEILSSLTLNRMLKRSDDRVFVFFENRC